MKRGEHQPRPRLVSSSACVMDEGNILASDGLWDAVRADKRESSKLLLQNAEQSVACDAIPDRTRPRRERCGSGEGEGSEQERENLHDGRDVEGGSTTRTRLFQVSNVRR
jgi:hypothetical protein